MMIDNVFSSIGISASGMTAQRRRLDFIANNIANVNTTRTPDGGPYKRKDVTFIEHLENYSGKLQGVDFQEAEINEDPKMVFDPSHPDANEEGYVAYPNINMVEEMVNMMSAVRAYEANVQVTTAAKDMITRSFDILR